MTTKNHNYRQPGTCGVYALRDPRTRAVRYVGSSINIEARFKQHLNAMDGTPARKAWVRELKASGNALEMMVLEHCDRTALRRCEKAWLDYFRARGGADLCRSIALGTQQKESSLRAENEALRRQVAELSNQISELRRC